jgi:hypothetical protein
MTKFDLFFLRQLNSNTDINDHQHFNLVINYTNGETKRARTAYTRHQVLGKINFI